MRRLRLVVPAAIVVLAASAAIATAGDNDSGFKTSVDRMLVPAATPQPGAPPGVTTEALLTVGDTLPDGYRFEAIPDGISLWPRGNGRLDLFVNHETSTVPFPYLPAATAEAHSQNDFDNAQVSVVSLNQHSQGALLGRMAIAGTENLQRLCSNFLAAKEHGFDHPIFFTNEEGIDWVNRSGRAWPPPVAPAPDFEATDAARQIGVVVAYDVRNGKHTTVYGMGRLNHENDVAVPGYGYPVVLSGDDPFVSNPAQSQLYMYKAASADAVLNDEGDLYAFVADPLPNGTRVDSYYGVPINSTMSLTGRFVRVPDFADDPNRSIAHGLRSNGTDVTSRDFTPANGYTPAYDPAPAVGWQTSPFTPTHGIDGPQWVLEQWGDRLTTNGNPTPVFQFVRIEDIAVDKRPSENPVIYLADSGRGSTSSTPTQFASTNGRIWRMVLDKNDPNRVLSLSVLVEGDNAGLKLLTEIHQPDNVETTASGSLMVTEDPGGGQQFPATGSTDPNTTTARLWQVDLGSYNPAIPDSVTKRVVAVVDQGLDEKLGYDMDPPDPTPTPPVPAFLISPGNLGAWESTGVIDTSAIFGPGTFLVNVQAHTLAVEWAPGDLNTVASNDPLPDFQYKREGGQLLLLRVPGA
jgi:secreted PhoX family phosphatase